MMNAKTLFLVGGAALVVGAMTFGGSLQAPPGLFKDLNDEIVDDALIVYGKQLFIDDHIIDEIKGAQVVLNRPSKDPRNPLIAIGPENYGFGSVLYDQAEKTFKLWYETYRKDEDKTVMYLDYATSDDGIAWHKPVVNDQDGTNRVFTPPIPGANAFGIFQDPVETNLARRYKMLFSASIDGTPKSLATYAAYSPDGIQWTADPRNPIIPFSDTQSCPYWDTRLRRYVAYLRFGPPNIRLISRIESQDFVNWSPKVTVLRPTKLDGPFRTIFYGMRVMAYEGIYVGLITTYHGETIKPIPADRLWMDKIDVQLVFSRDGFTWTRVAGNGAIPQRRLNEEGNWEATARQATFLPNGEHGKGWDWGQIYPLHSPLIVGDQIRIYYTGRSNRHWASYHGDPRDGHIGLATLRLDGFVSVDAANQGTMTTKTLLFIGDQLEVNADAAAGSIQVEALDPDGNVIEGFAKENCTPLTTDSVRHVLQWNDNPDCHLIQARPIKLRFHLNKAKLYSFTPRIRHTHYVPSYD